MPLDVENRASTKSSLLIEASKKWLWIKAGSVKQEASLVEKCDPFGFVFLGAPQHFDRSNVS